MAWMAQDLESRIGELMAAMGWEPAQVAEAAGVTVSAVSQWLGRSSTPVQKLSLRPAALLERRTGFSALWLGTGEGEKMAHARKGWPFESIPQARWERLSERQRGRLEQLILDALEDIDPQAHAANARR